jgi:hypothetical protein
MIPSLRATRSCAAPDLGGAARAQAHRAEHGRGVGIQRSDGAPARWC